MTRYERGELIRSFDKEWNEGAYRFGGDWLTGQAFDLINLDVEKSHDLEEKLQQFETSKIDQCLSDFIGLAFGLYTRDKPKYAPAIPVTIHKCGFVFSGTSIVLVWIDLSLDSSLPESWLDFISVLKKRESRSYLQHFVDSNAIRRSHSDLVFRIEQYFLGNSTLALIKYSSRNLQRFTRFKLLTESDEEASRFLQATIGNAFIPTNGTQDLLALKNDQGGADIRWAWGMDSVSGVLIQQPDSPGERGSVQLQNSFNFSDRWLTHVICLLQFHLLILLERDLVRALTGLPKMRKVKHPVLAFTQILRMKKRYEAIMDTFMDSYWRLGLIQIHSHESRHQLFLGLRTKLGLDETVSRFNKKLSILGSFLVEKQKSFLGWFLIYVPFLSLMIGILSINVRGLTSNEGLSLGALAGLLIVITVTYVIAIGATRVFLIIRKSKSI